MTSHQTTDSTAQPPNIILILMDDMGWRDLGCCGSAFYETPYLDRLAAQGMRFTDAYAAAPVCSPTRASLLTGRYPASVGITNYIGGDSRGKLIDAPYLHHLPLEEVSLARALQEGGYRTWHIGKWHLGARPFYPDHHGFQLNIAGSDWGHPHHGYFSPWGIETLPEGPAGQYLTDRLTDEAIRLIQQDHSSPFFLNLWHYAVHTPIQAPASLVEKYQAKARALGLDRVPALVEGDHFPTAAKRHLRIQRRVVQSDPAYAAMIENLDTNIGRLLQAVEDAGLSRNTLILFTSDNGGLATSEGSPTCNKPLAEGKGWMYEGGTREPLIVKWPGVVPPGSLCQVPITSPDFYPTLLQAARLPLRPEQHHDGVSFLPLLQGQQCLDREAIYWHYPHYGNQGGAPGSSLRMGDYKLMEFFEDSHVELYNLREDIGEEHNLAPREPGIARKMHQMLAAWRQTVEAQIPVRNPDWIEEGG